MPLLCFAGDTTTAAHQPCNHMCDYAKEHHPFTYILIHQGRRAASLRHGSCIQHPPAIALSCVVLPRPCTPPPLHYTYVNAHGCKSTTIQPPALTVMACRRHSQPPVSLGPLRHPASLCGRPFTQPLYLSCTALHMRTSSNEYLR